MALYVGGTVQISHNLRGLDLLVVLLQYMETIHFVYPYSFLPPHPFVCTSTTTMFCKNRMRFWTTKQLSGKALPPTGDHSDYATLLEAAIAFSRNVIPLYDRPVMATWLVCWVHWVVSAWVYWDRKYRSVLAWSGRYVGDWCTSIYFQQIQTSPTLGMSAKRTLIFQERSKL